jgi:Double-GTPase 1
MRQPPPMPPESTQLVLGLPGSGKTTFLSALWYLVVWAEVPTSLRLDRLHGNKEHLNRISSDWLSCRPVERTRIGSDTIVSMKLVSADGTERTDVYFPDMSGELFNLQWKERRCSRAHYELARAASGVLLFVHPGTVLEPVGIDEVAPIVAEVGPHRGDDEEDAPSPWDADRAPTQVKLVELLQFLVREPIALPHVRVAVVVSAWDLVASRAATPAAWLAARLPLLDQYLRGNPECYTARIYGISAQGGDLGRDGERLLSKPMPAERIVVVGDESRAHDLTAPVSWLMGETKGWAN